VAFLSPRYGHAVEGGEVAVSRKHPISQSLHCCCTIIIFGERAGVCSRREKPCFSKQWPCIDRESHHRGCSTSSILHTNFPHQCRAEIFWVSTHQSSYFGSQSCPSSLWQRGGQAPNLFSACSLSKMDMHNLSYPAAAAVQL